MKKQKVKEPKQPEIKNKGGRPKKEIDEDMVYKLAQTLLPIESIATILGCGKDLLYQRFSDTLQKGREERKSSLVQHMWKNAMEHNNTTMQIWLSKQHLGFKEPAKVEEQEAQAPVFNIIINEGVK